MESLRHSQEGSSSAFEARFHKEHDEVNSELSREDLADGGVQFKTGGGSDPGMVSNKFEDALFDDFYDSDEEDQVPQLELKEKLYKAHFRNVAEMNHSEIVEATKTVLPDLDGIVSGSVYSERWRAFVAKGVRRYPLLKYLICGPFTTVQDNWIRHVLMDHFYPDYETATGEFIKKVNMVLYYEAIIRIYALKNQVTLQQAEREMKLKSSYKDPLPEDLVKKAEMLAI